MWLCEDIKINGLVKVHFRIYKVTGVVKLKKPVNHWFTGFIFIFSDRVSAPKIFFQTIL